MSKSRVGKLEGLVRQRPCPGCGRAYIPQSATRDAVDLTRLSAGKRQELDQLLATATRQCDRCGRNGWDIDRLTDDQKHRTLTLLRVLLGHDDRGAIP